MRTRKLSGLVLIALVALVTTFAGLRRAHAQTITVPFSYAVGIATHTSCPAVITGTTQYCYPSDGPYVSINGGAWQPIPLSTSVAGLTGVTVCNATGGSCVAATVVNGVVTLNVPTSVTVTAPTATLH